jgi:hypothetical protein
MEIVLQSGVRHRESCLANATFPIIAKGEDVSQHGKIDMLYDGIGYLTAVSSHMQASLQVEENGRDT